MLFLLSVLLVFGAVGVFVGNMVLSAGGDLGPGLGQMIHAQVPWLLLAALIGGAGLGVFSLVRARRWYKWGIVPIQLLCAGFLTWYFISGSFLPAHQLALSEGDPFPSYALVDQDGTPQSSVKGAARKPALYVFYRGDW